MRETSAQSLGVVLRHLDAESVSQVLKVLLQMLNEDTWEVRHGGLLAIKYLMLVRQVRDAWTTVSIAVTTHHSRPHSNTGLFKK